MFAAPIVPLRMTARDEQVALAIHVGDTAQVRENLLSRLQRARIQE